MKRLLILFFAIPFFVAAQNKTLYVQGASPSLYLTHTVSPKENFYSIGRMYNVSPKEIAPLNNLEIEKGLSLGQTIKIPLIETNFTQNGTAATDEALIPLYHSVQEKEGLYHISITYNKVPIASLKQWNNIQGEGVSKGTDLIVGYLKVKKNLSSLASNAKDVQPAKIVKEETVAEPVETPKKEPQKTVEEEVKPAAVEQQPTPAKTEVVNIVENKESLGEGVFATDYKQPSKKMLAKETGTGATFKSTSGWSDGRYYCLHNAAPSGTIIKVTNPANGKSVYAKVLGAMPDMLQNNNLLIRISNAAAESLGVNSDKFDCELEYSK